MSQQWTRIESRQNQRLKELVRLVEQRKARQASGRFVVEGAFEIRQALAAGIAIEELYVLESRQSEGGVQTIVQGCARWPQLRLFDVAGPAFEKISQRQGPDGVLAVATAPALALESLQLPENPLLLVVEKVEKPGNLGALIRSAEAAGADALICCDPVADLYNPHVIRNSRGLVFHLPAVVAAQEQVAAFLQERKIAIVATTPEATLAHWDCDLRAAVAIFAGAEHEGLSDYWLQRAQKKVRIPMAGNADSLNVNVASALVLFEALRQRGSRG